MVTDKLTLIICLLTAVLANSQEKSSTRIIEFGGLRQANAVVDVSESNYLVKVRMLARELLR